MLCRYTELGPVGSEVTESQQCSVAMFETSAGPQPVYLGMRFGSAPDALKSHDYVYSFPIHFDDKGGFSKFRWVDNFTLTFN